MATYAEIKIESTSDFGDSYTITTKDYEYYYGDDEESWILKSGSNWYKYVNTYGSYSKIKIEVLNNDVRT